MSDTGAPANTPSPAIDFDVAGAKAAGYSDEAIASYLAQQTNFDLPAAKKAGYDDNAVVGYLAKQPEEKPPETPSTSITGQVKGFVSGLINSAGSVVSGVGDIIKGEGTEIGDDTRAKDTRDTAIQSAFNAIDQGKQPDVSGLDKHAQGLVEDYLSAPVKSSNPLEWDRAALRDRFHPENPAGKANDLAVSKTLGGAGTSVAGVGADTSDFGSGLLTDEEKGRTGVKITSMIGGLIPILGAAAAGGLPALIGVGGVQGYGDAYDKAKQAGATDEDAATAGTVNGLVQGGLMAVPVHKAMEVMDALPATAKSSVLKAAIEVAKSSGTMVVFSQLSTLADNAVAKATYDPNRDMMQGVGQDMGVQAVVGALLPVAGAAAHVGVDAARRVIAPDVKAAATANDVMSTDNMDDAIATASKAAQSTTPIAESIVAGKDALDAAAPDPQLEKLKTFFGGLNTGEVEKQDDDTYNFNTKDSDGKDIAIPLKVWDPTTAPTSDTTISPDLAEAQRQYYTGQHGIDVVYFENNPRIPFDGAVDPAQPNTLFLSNDPQRNAEQVAGHEVGHVLEDVKAPDGASLADLLHQEVLANVTDTGWDYSKSLFSSTAPDRGDFQPGEQGDAEHAQAVTSHLIKELTMDLHGEAPKFDTFIPKVMNEVEARYGKSVAVDMLQKFMDGVKTAMETLRKFFTADGSDTISQDLVTNLDRIHDIIAKMHAAKLGENAGFVDVKPVEGEAPADRAARLAALGVREIPSESRSAPDYVRKANTELAAQIPNEDPADRAARLAAIGVKEIPREMKLSPKPKGEFDQEEWHPDEPTFFSALTRGVQDLKMDKATPGQWEATIKNMPGIKSEETAWSGVNEWLRSQTGPVTKADVLQHLNDNDVRLNEVVKGNTISAKDEEEYDEIKQRYRFDPDSVSQAEYDRMNDLEQRSAYGSEGHTKFSSYTLPGGENYREMLLMLPKNDAVNREGFDKWYAETFPGAKPTAELTQEVMGRLYDRYQQEVARDYKSSHFDEPNIVAHTRFDDRKIVEPGFLVENTKSRNQSQAFPTREAAETYQKSLPGNLRANTKIIDVQIPKRDLHIAEIQSDWHQAGRRQGYNGDYKSSLKVEQDAGGIWRVRDANGQRVDLDGQSGFASEGRARTAISVHARKEGGVPDAPFKASWHELAMKRMLRYAAENGYDHLSWDTGQTQADRYDLSKSVKQIKWSRWKDNDTVKYYVEAKDLDGDELFSKTATKEELPSILGKEHADRVVSAKTNDGEFSGNGLKVGGEGMKGFYDKILPNFVNKYAKKWGVKVEDTKIVTDQKPQYSIVEDPQDHRGYAIMNDHEGEIEDRGFASYADAKRETQKLNGEADGGVKTVHSIAITPEMRKSVMRGQPKFSPRKVEEITEGKKVPKEVALASGFKNSEAIASSKRWQTGRDLKVAMQEAVQRLAAKAGVDLTDKSHETTKHLIGSVTADVMHALKQNAGAIGWYDLKTRQALRVASLVHPEIATDPNARFAFVFGLAASSNGVKVDKNFDYAEQIYNYYKEKGEMPTHLKFDLAQESINKTLEMFNTLSKKWGLDKFRKFMLTEYAMKEITALSGVKPAGEHADTIGRGAAIMGPKIGNGFFSNLYGHFDALTMDRWLIRTWGRHTGTLIVPQPELADSSRARVGAALRALDPKDYDKMSQLIGHPVQPNMNYVDDLAAAVKDASTDPAARGELASTPEGDELRKASINLVKYLDGQKEAPEGPHERVYIRKVFQAALDGVRQDPRYAAITMADMQAVLWYAEKRLYEHAKTDADTDETGGVRGYEEEAEAPDYANAAVGMVKNSNKTVLKDPTLSDAEKRARIISDRRINAALAKEASGRAAETQSGLAGPDTGQGGRQLDAGGFTGREKRAFARAVAAQDVRSARLGGEPSSFSFERKSSGDGGKSRVLKSLGVTYDAEWKAGAGLRRVYEKNGSKVPVRILELAPGDDANAARFEQAITASKNSSKDGAAVAVYPVEDYKNFRLLMSDDGKSGAAIKPDGDIISVFSSNGTGHAMFEAAIAAGGRKLDAFDTILPDFYHSHGFVEAARTAWNDEFAPEGWDKEHFKEFNNGKPDVVLMVLDRGNVSPVLEKAKVYGDWDSAAKAQEKLLKKMDREQPAAVINLRLDRLDGEKPFTLAQAKEELAKIGVDVVASRTRKINGKEGEPGAVMHLSRPLSAEEAKRVSEALKQEAIPQFANGRGEIHGPDTGKYGDFNPEKFHTLQEGAVLHSPRVSDETRERMIQRNPAYANMFRKPMVEKTPVTEPGEPAKVEPPTPKEVSAASKEASEAAAPKTRTLTTTHPEGKGEKIERALNGEETRALENEPQEKQASKLVDKDPERALRIAMREEQAPKNLLPTFVYFELERRATKAGDEAMIEKLRASPLAKEVTTAARTVQSFATRDPQSAVAKIQEVETAREAATEARAGGPLETAKAVEVAKAVPAVKKTVRESIKARPASDWAKFIDEIVCK